MHSEIAVESMTLSPWFEDLDVGELVEALGVGVMLLGIGVVDAVDLGRLEDHLGADLHGAQAGRGVGGEERVAGAGGEDHDAPLLEVARGAAADVGLGDLLHLDRRHARASARRASRGRPAAPAR